MAYEAGVVVGQLLGQLFGIAIGALIAAFIVQLLTNRIAGFRPSYAMAYKATFFGFAASLAVGFFLGFFVGAAGSAFSGESVIFIVVIGFLLQTFVYGLQLKHPEQGAIGFSKALQVSLIQTLIGGALIGAIAIIFGILK